ncbi:MAG: mitochondrial fusion and transport protein ugo1 [Thelocarpon superellum]|nr:MAG: mitochondrial fusion and transport protein ugo1 [Thelocarpon superellum]
MAQPFEVAKTILQCHLAIGPDDSLQAERAKRRPDYHRGRSYGDYGSDESDPDEPAYFTTNTASPHIVRRRRDFSYSDDDLSSGGTSKHASRPPGNFILSQPSSLLEALSQLWAKEGAWGVWKGANSTFIYNVLLKSAESWIRSLLAALFNLPDASLLSGSVDIADGPFPMASLGVAVAAAGLAGALLSPLDIVRTQLVGSMMVPSIH